MKKARSTLKYWLILVCWFVSPFLLKLVFDIQISFLGLAFGFVLPFATFVIISHVYEGNIVSSYLRKHYPQMLRKQNLPFGMEDGFDFDFLFSFSPPNDTEWGKIQSYYKKFFPFPFVSFGAIILFMLINILFLTVG